MNPEIIKFSKSLPRLFCVAILFYAAILKLAAGGKYISEFPFRQLLGMELTVFVAAIVVALEICIGYENLFTGGSHAREKAVLLASLFGVFLLVSLTRLIPYVNTTYFPHGCGCFPDTSVGWLDPNSPIGQNVRNLFLLIIALINLVIVFKFEDRHENKSVRTEAAITT